MRDQAELIEQLDAARGRMRVVLLDIDPQMRVSAAWTIKEVVAHITGWDDATIEMLHAHITGASHGASRWQGIDLYNARSVARRAPLSYEQVIDEWERTRDRLKRLIDEMPPEKLEARLRYLWGREGTTARLVAIMADHEAEHAYRIGQLKARSPEGRS